jgi:hypothetical protein
MLDGWRGTCNTAGMNTQHSESSPRVERKFFVIDGVPIVSLQSSGGEVKTLAYGAHGSHAYDWASGSRTVVEISEVEFWVRVCHAQSAIERVAATRQ